MVVTGHRNTRQRQTGTCLTANENGLPAAGRFRTGRTPSSADKNGLRLEDITVTRKRERERVKMGHQLLSSDASTRSHVPPARHGHISAFSPVATDCVGFCARPIRPACSSWSKPGTMSSAIAPVLESEVILGGRILPCWGLPLTAEHMWGLATDPSSASSAAVVDAGSLRTLPDHHRGLCVGCLPWSLPLYGPCVNRAFVAGGSPVLYFTETCCFSYCPTTLILCKSLDTALPMPGMEGTVGCSQPDHSMQHMRPSPCCPRQPSSRG